MLKEELKYAALAPLVKTPKDARDSHPYGNTGKSETLPNYSFC